MQVINIRNKREFFTTDPIILKNNNKKNTMNNSLAINLVILDKRRQFLKTQTTEPHTRRRR